MTPSLGPTGTYARFILALVGLGITAWILSEKTYARKLQGPAAAVFLCILGVVVWTVGLGVFAASPLYGLIRFVNFSMFIPIAFVIFSRVRFATGVLAVVAAAAVQLLAVVLQVNGRYGGTWGGITVSGPSASVLAERITRYTGFLLNPNNLGLFLAYAGVLAFTCLIFSPGFRERVAASAFFIACLYGVILSSSRTALIAVSVSCLTVAFVRSMWLGLAACGAAAAIVEGASFIGFVDLSQIVASYTDIANNTDASSRQRSDLWADQLNKLRGWEVFVGKGFGAVDPSLFRHDAVEGFRIKDKLLTAGTVDNSWLKLWLEGGVFAVSLMSAILGGTGLLIIWKLMEGRKIAARSSLEADESLFARAKLAGLLGLLIIIAFATFSYDILDINPWNSIIWVLMGFALSQIDRMPPGTGFTEDAASEREISAAHAHHDEGLNR
ncbi:O-antigen ligase family protein [Gordonia sputi]